jgi:O-Antigen ligase
MPNLILIYVAGIAVTAGLAAASGLVAKLFYLAGCLVLGIWSSRKNHWDYLLLTLWIAALTPFARRLVDLAAGWDATNVMLVAPFLVAAPMIPAVLHRLRTLNTVGVLFPGVVALCIFYGFVVTLLRGSLVPAVVGLADWGIPLLYYFFIIAHRQSVAALVERLPAFVTANMLLLGAYGIWQFVDPPIWDRYWMKSADIGAFGLAEPFAVRVFSTLNSAGPYSCWIMVLIVLSFGFTSRIMPVARLAGILSLVFTTVRTSWGGLGLAVAIIILSSGRMTLKYAIGVIFAGVAAAAVVMSVPQINEVITSRIATFNDLEQDGSLLQREDISSKMLSLIAETPLGLGIGGLGRGTIEATNGTVPFTGPIDNGILETMGALGWFVGAVYFVALIGSVVQFGGADPKFARQQRVTRAASIACLAALPITNIATGVTGTIMWTMVALTAAMRVASSESSTQATDETRRRFEPAVAKQGLRP